MSFSTLYSAITRGKWFISFREVDAHRHFIDSLINRSLSVTERTLLSERRPLTAFFDSKTEMKSGNNFADAPQGSIAIIPLTGTMLKHGTYCSYGTTEVAKMIEEAAESPKVDGVVLEIDSGGGSVDAIAPMAQAIQNAQSKGKPVVACCDLCASAAYYVACYCDEIIASNSISSEFGSIGVMMSFEDYAKAYEKEGIIQHTIYSNLSTHKNAAFEAARKGDYSLIKTEELDPLAQNFQEAVKEHRKKLDLAVDGIIAGRMFFARDAQAKGLIDSVGSLNNAVKRTREIRRDAAINEYINSKK